MDLEMGKKIRRKLVRTYISIITKTFVCKAGRIQDYKRVTLSKMSSESN